MLLQVLAPTQSVKEAMNNVLAAQRQREAAFEQVGKARFIQFYS